MEMEVRRVSGHNDVLKKEYDYIARRSGFDRSKGAETRVDVANSKSFINSALSEDLNKLEVSDQNKQGRQSIPSRKGSTKD